MVMQKFGGKQVAFRAPGEDFQVGSGGAGVGGGGGVIRTRKRNHTSGGKLVGKF